MSLSAPGIGSGLDVNGLVGQLMALERRPLTTLTQREAGVQAKISAFGQLSNLVSGLRTAANGLNDAAKFAATKPTVEDNAGFTATSTTSAAAGNYAVEVTTLAQSQRVAISADTLTKQAGSATNIAAGSLVIGFGTLAQIGASSPAETKTLDFAGGTVNDLRDAINDADLGVRASVINDGSVQRLILSGDDTGAEQAFSVQGLGASFDPNVMGDQANDPVFGLQAAQNAVVVIDGLTINRSSNTLDDVIDGVTLNLTKAEPGDARKLTIAGDISGARGAIDAFVKAYNDTNNAIRTQTQFNAETRQASTLTGDSTARSLQGQLRGIVGAAFEGLGDTSRLADIGITFQLDGTLSVNSTKLTAALNDPERDVAAFFTGVEGTQGFAARVSDALGNFVGSNGLLTGRTEGLKSSITTIESQRESLTRRLESVEARFRAQFSALDAMIASMTQTSSFLGQQLANLPGAFRGN